MGDESETFLVPMLNHDIHVRCHWGVEYINRSVVDMDFLEAGKKGLEEMEKETTWLVEGGWEEVGQQAHDL